MIISSKNNGAVKAIRSLRYRKERESSGLYFVEGIRIVTEAADSGAEIEQIVVAPDLLDSEIGRATVAGLLDSGVTRLEVTPDVFQSIAQKDHPQGIGAVVRHRWDRLADCNPGDELCWVVLSALQDPGNLGTILRTSDAVGAAGVILLGSSTDPYDPTAVRASMGAIFSQRLVRAPLNEVETWKRDHGWHVMGTSDAASTVYRDACFTFPLLLFMGSEREGLSKQEQNICDEMIRIPMVGRSDSLNVAVATGIMLYEIYFQRH